jgi:hypothetical protein
MGLTAHFSFAVSWLCASPESSTAPAARAAAIPLPPTRSLSSAPSRRRGEAAALGWLPPPPEGSIPWLLREFLPISHTA